MTDADRMLTLACAAKGLGVCLRTLRRWARSGKIPAVRYPSGRYRISAAIVAEIKAGQRGPSADTEAYTR